MIIEKIEKNGEIFAVLPISYYEKLIDDAEMLEDVVAFDAAIARAEPAFSLEVWNDIEKTSRANVHKWKRLGRQLRRSKAHNKSVA